MPNHLSLRVGNDSRQAVESAIKRVRKAYKRGLAIWRAYPDGVPPNWFDKEARRTGIHRCTLRRARQIGHPKSGLTKQELSDLFALSRKHRHAFSPTVLYQSMVITDRGMRFRFLKAAIQGGWTYNQARLELTEMRGRSIAAGTEVRKMRRGRAGAGKPPSVAATTEGLLAQVSKLSTHWVRWFARLTEEQEPGEPKKHAFLTDLPAAVQKALKKIAPAMEDLNALAERQLQK